MNDFARPPRGKSGPNGTQQDILVYITDQISVGVWQPGERIPTRADLRRRFSTTQVTVQQALHRLAVDGFICADGRRGTFVAEHPPCLNRVALVFPTTRQYLQQSINMWSALAKEATQCQRSGDYTIHLYTGLNGHTDEPDYQRLLRDVRARRLRGIIFTSPPFLLVDTELWEAIRCSGIRQAAIMPDAASLGMISLGFDGQGYLPRLMRHFTERGRRRLAAISSDLGSTPDAENSHGQHIMSAVVASGLETHPYWIHGIHPAAAASVRRLTWLLFSAPPAQRPDALWIADDMLVDPVTRGVVDAGIRVPEELEIVAHANFPWIAPAVTPVKYLGYDISALLARTLARLLTPGTLDTATEIAIPACFDHESGERSLVPTITSSVLAYR